MTSPFLHLNSLSPAKSVSWGGSSSRGLVYVTSLWRGDAICRCWPWSSLIQVMTWRLFGAKPWTTPDVLPTGQLNSGKFTRKIKIQTFLSRKYVWNIICKIGAILLILFRLQCVTFIEQQKNTFGIDIEADMSPRRYVYRHRLCHGGPSEAGDCSHPPPMAHRVCRGSSCWQPPEQPIGIIQSPPR